MTTGRRRNCWRGSTVGLALAAAAACGTTVPLSQRGGTIGVAGSGAGRVTAAQGALPVAGSMDAGALTGATPSGPGDPVAGVSPTTPPAADAATGAGGAPLAPISGAVGSAGAPGPRAATSSGAASKAGPGVAPKGAASSTAVKGRPSAGGAKPSAGSTTKGTGQPTTGGAKQPAPATMTKATGPFKLGFVYFDASSSQAVNSAAGVTSSTTITPKEIFDSLVKTYNMNGGIEGRQVVPVEQPVSNTSANFNSDAAAACQTFTQDNPVTVVLDAAYGGGNGFDSCLVRAGVEDLTIAVPNDAATLRGLPYEVAIQRMTPDRAYVAALTQLAKTGYLTGGSKLGVFLDNCSSSTAAYNNSVVPAVKRLGLTVAKTFTSSCIGGEGGLGQAGSDTSSAVLQFRSAGVDRVMVLSAVDPTYYILFSQAASSQGYTPGYVMTTNAEANVLEMNFAADQKVNIHGAGNEPTLDIDKPKLPGTAAEAACDAASEAGGTTPSTTSDFYFVSAICGPFALLQAAFRVNGADATAAGLAKAIAGLGTSFSDPGVLGGAADLSHQDAPATVSVFGYDAGCSCLTYTGGAVPA